MAEFDALDDRAQRPHGHELERRLTARGSGVTEAFDRLHTRADALGPASTRSARTLSALQQRLPKLADQVEGVAANAQQLHTQLDQSTAAIDAVKTGAPELITWMDQQKGRFGRDLNERKAKLDALTTEVRDLESAVEQSRARLKGFNDSLDQDLERAKRDGAALESAVEDLHGTGQQVAQLLAGADAKVEATDQAMQKKIDQILSQVAEKADLAVLRSQDVIRRAEGEVTRKLQGESQQALDDLSKARTAQIAELAKRASRDPGRARADPGRAARQLGDHGPGGRRAPEPGPDRPRRLRRDHPGTG